MNTKPPQDTASGPPVRLNVVRHDPPLSKLPPVWVTYLAHRDIWLLVEEYHIDVPVQLHAGIADVCFQIPQNFEFDLASVPRILWSLISSFELSLVAPLIHDYLYRFQGTPVHHRVVNPEAPQEEYYMNLTRKQADDLFYDLMIREGVVPWKAKAAHRAVRWFAPRWK